MTTAALIQSTSVLTDTVVAADFLMAGAPGGIFDASPTDTVVSVLNAVGVGAVVFINGSMTIIPAAVAIPCVSPVAWTGESVVPNAQIGQFILPGAADVAFVGANAATPIVPLPVRLITGPESGVIPVEIVDAPGEDVIEVKLYPGTPNYTPVFVDPTNPMRKKVHFVE